MLPRPRSVFDDLDLNPFPTGAPPPLGPGNGQLYLVVRSFATPRGDVGPAVLLIDHADGSGWGPPGGLTNRTDHSPLHAALREFGEEVGADWRNLANAADYFQIVRVMPGPHERSEAWMMLVDLDAAAAEEALFRQDRSGWTLEKRMKTPLSTETSGYAFVTLDALMSADKKTGAFKLRNHTRKLRFSHLVRLQAELIAERLKHLP